MYADLVSGDPGGLRDVALSIYQSAEKVDVAADRIAHGTAVPVWQGGAALVFRAVGQNTYVAVAGTSWHVSRAGDFVLAAAERYDAARKSGERLIKFWRQRDPNLTPDQVALLGTLVQLNLTMVIRAYGDWLAAAGMSLHRDGGKLFEEWLVNGFEKDAATRAMRPTTAGSRSSTTRRAAR